MFLGPFNLQALVDILLLSVGMGAIFKCYFYEENMVLDVSGLFLI